MSEIAIQCHNCGEESIIQDKYCEKNQDDIEYCPYCGSTNIDIS